MGLLGQPLLLTGVSVLIEHCNVRTMFAEIRSLRLTYVNNVQSFLYLYIRHQDKTRDKNP